MSITAPSTVVLITGANSGIGLAAAEVIVSASKEYHVIIGSRNVKNGTKAVEQLLATPGRYGTVSSVQIDVTDQASITKAASEIEERFGRVDVLVNNAGIVSTAKDVATNLEETFRVNVVGPALVIGAFRPLLQKSKNARSIFVSSGLGSLTFANNPEHPIYSADWCEYRISKAALNMLVSQERKKDRETGVKTYVLCPGLVRSNLRGKEEEQVSAGGAAGDPMVSGKLVLDIMEGRRDGDKERFINETGTYDW